MTVTDRPVLDAGRKLPGGGGIKLGSEGHINEGGGRRKRAQDCVTCVGDFERLQVAGVKDTCAGVRTTGSEVRQGPDGDARDFDVSSFPWEP